jgi:hypothetical protein
MAVLCLEFRATATGGQIAETLVLSLTSVKSLWGKGLQWLYMSGLEGIHWVSTPLWRFWYLKLALGIASGEGC